MTNQVPEIGPWVLWSSQKIGVKANSTRGMSSFLGTFWWFFKVSQDNFDWHASLWKNPQIYMNLVKIERKIGKNEG